MQINYSPRSHWGNSLWSYIHTISSLNDTQLVKEILQNIQYIIPCNTCKPHYKEYLLLMDDYIKKYNNIPLFYWSVDIHNKVNSRTGKRIITYEEAINKWLNKIYY